MMNELINQVIHGDCLNVMRGIPDGSIDLTVTSPPYDNLRDYKGYSFNFEAIAKELYRVTKPGGVLVWVVNDSTINGSETLTSCKQKIFFREECGFFIHDTMIYNSDSFVKPCNNRYWAMFEYMFVLSKGKPKTVNLICDRKNKNVDCWNKKRSIRNKDGTMSPRRSFILNEYSKRTNIWKYGTGFMKTTTDRYAFEHPAMFPEKLARDHILSWSNEGDIVYDPMCGSGTVPKMAILTNRQWIASECSAEYCAIAQRRVTEAMNAPRQLELAGVI